jgi:hypothetical protein
MRMKKKKKSSMAVVVVMRGQEHNFVDREKVEERISCVLYTISAITTTDRREKVEREDELRYFTPPLPQPQPIVERRLRVRMS